ncbi:MAG: outer rane chaperone Skp (OmpH) [Firmicutes bacterium]|nr:outer rane chaperone Skp (OmpH) [Bacillota bacterium]
MGSFEKKQIKIVVIVIAVLVVLGLAGFALSQSGMLSSGSSSIGCVDVQVLMSKHPDTAAAQATIKAEAEKAQNDFNTKSASMNDQDKQAYFAQVQQQLTAKQKALITPIRDKVMASVKEVADAKGLGVVVDKNLAAQGGIDITDEVAKKITGQ